MQRGLRAKCGFYEDAAVELKPYLKIVTRNHYGVCAIYEPHPFRNCAIKEAVEKDGKTMKGHTGVNDNAWCWVYYDWIGNPVGVSEKMPDGTLVDKFTEENLGDKDLADYLNQQDEEIVEACRRRNDTK